MSVEEALGYVFRDPSLRERALTHDSWANEQGGSDNERFEFLGDGLLRLFTSERLLQLFPDETEGELSARQHVLVSTPTLAALGRELGVGAELRLGRGEEGQGGRDKDKILEDAVEALLAAIWTDGGTPDGLVRAREIVHRWTDERIARLDAEAARWWEHPVNALQERTQALKLGTPRYPDAGRSGPDHEPIYIVEVVVGGQVLGRGEGPNKSEARRNAALAALAALAKEEEA